MLIRPSMKKYPVVRSSAPAPAAALSSEIRMLEVVCANDNDDRHERFNKQTPNVITHIKACL